MKRVLSLVLALVLVIGLLPVTARAAELDNGLVYEVCEDHVEITGYTGSATEVVIPAEIEEFPVTVIGESAFFRCESLTGIDLPDSVTSIGDYAFAYCYGLAGIDIPGSVTYIGDGAFHYCTSLTDVVIPEGVTHIGDSAFFLCYDLTSLDLPDSLTYIGSYAFASCPDLTDVDLPDGVTHIGSHAFFGCYSLTSIVIPDSVTFIGEEVFSNCTGLIEIRVDENNPNYSSDDRGVLFDKEKTVLMQAPGMITDSYVIPDSVTSICNDAFTFCKILTDVVIPEGVTRIGECTFYGCHNLASIVIPESVTYIGDQAFESCIKLTDIVIPARVTYIGHQAFSGCKSLPNINIPDSVTTIGDYAFHYCASLTSIAIPASVTYIGMHAFNYNNSLTEIRVDENNLNYSSDDRGVLFDKEKTLLIQTPGAITDSYEIPEGVISIGEDAFSSCVGLASIVFPDSVTSIGRAAFSCCDSLANIRFTGDAPEFGDEVFVLVTATAYYPAGNPTWTEDVMQDYGGTIDWVPDDPCHVHEYTPIVTAPTCEEQGFTFYTCACGDYYVTDYVDALGHDFVDGFCTRCGNGNFAPEDELTRGMFCYALWNYCGSPEPLSDVNPFTDISESDYYYDAVLWVVENGITNGLTRTEFGPGVETNRAQVATWLWRAAGSPTAPARNPFVDVGNTDFFSSSVLWAAAEGCMEPLEPNRFGPYEKCLYGHINWIFQVHTHEYTATVTDPTCTEQGYTTYDCSCGDRYRNNYVDALGHDYADGACVRCGKVDPDSVVISGPADPGNGMFAPDEVLTRGEFFYALWNFYGSPEPESTANPFTDVKESDYYYDAVMWAVGSGISLGSSATQFGTDIAVLRGQAVTWLWRAAGYPEAPDENPFYDVKEGDFFYEAVLWATSKGYMHYSTNPVDDYGSINIHHFAPYDRCYYKDISWVPGNHPHIFTAVVTKPTCTEQGYTTYTCTDCGYSYAANYVDALDHKYTAVVTKPTCTEQGYTTYTCTICEYSYAANYVDALGHDYADDRCTRCGEVDPTCWEPCSGMFAPDDVLTRGMFFYALWNFYGSPEPESTENPFTDITESDYYYDAALWAAESGISLGVSATQFGPDSYINRAQAAAFLWRAAGSPEVQGDIPYTDVPPGTFYDRAALWATTVALCMGPMDATRFGPNEYCLYGHINWVPADHTHIFNAVVTEPTCTEGGYTTYTALCGYGYATKFVDALGHDYADGSCTRCGEADPDYAEPVVTPFPDVPADSFYAKPVLWAVENGITNGTSDNTFSPGDQCLRAHVVTFLWRAAGSPKPTKTDNPFTDVKPADFYYKAVLWAVENEITNGISADKFGSYDVCNRAQVVTFLWRAFGCPEPMFYKTSFTDVKEGDYFYKAVLWAVENGITNGMTATEFGPNSPCNRAQVVTFLYRAYNN